MRTGTVSFVILMTMPCAGPVSSGFAQDEPRPLCCGVKNCEANEAQVGADQCCETADLSRCRTVANLGKRCQDDPAAIATGTPERGGVAGCAEVPGVACIGGGIPAGDSAVAGCVCIGDVCEADVDFPNGKDACTRIAVDACCAADACL